MKSCTYFLILFGTLTTAGCGVKGAPMPRRDEVFIEKTMIRHEADDEAKDKTTILPKKDPR